MPLVVTVVAIALAAFLVGLITGYVYTLRQWMRSEGHRQRQLAAMMKDIPNGVDGPLSTGVQQH